MVKVGQPVQFFSKNPEHQHNNHEGPYAAIVTKVEATEDATSGDLLVFPAGEAPFQLASVANFEHSDPAAVGPEVYFRGL